MINHMNYVNLGIRALKMEQFYTSNVREQSSTAKVGGLTCVETWIDLKTTLKL